MAHEHILIVEDERKLADLLRDYLSEAGYTVSWLDRGDRVVSRVKQDPPALILLDIMLPGMDGIEVCKVLRTENETAEIPIIMLTAKGEETDIVEGFELGADDYITKPFSPKILLSRIKAVLRRKVKEEAAPSTPEQGEVIKTGNIIINPGRYEVTVDDQQVNLTPTEFGILKLLAKRPGWVFSRQQIIDEVRGYDYMITPRAIDVQVFSLRKKMGDAGKKIETVRGIGYRFNDSN